MVLKYNERYMITDRNGNINTAYFRKGEDYDWWEDCVSLCEIKDVIEYEECIESGINYDKLLDDWAEEIYSLMDRAMDRRDTYDFGTNKYFELEGYIDGLTVALAKLHYFEKRLRKKYTNKNKKGDNE